MSMCELGLQRHDAACGERGYVRSKPRPGLQAGSSRGNHRGELLEDRVLLCRFKAGATEKCKDYLHNVLWDLDFPVKSICFFRMKKTFIKKASHMSFGSLKAGLPVLSTCVEYSKDTLLLQMCPDINPAINAVSSSSPKLSFHWCFMMFTCCHDEFKVMHISTSQIPFHSLCTAFSSELFPVSQTLFHSIINSRLLHTAVCTHCCHRYILSTEVSHHKTLRRLSI